VRTSTTRESHRKKIAGGCSEKLPVSMVTGDMSGTLINSALETSKGLFLWKFQSQIKICKKI
jgi:hypothetical protein